MRTRHILAIAVLLTLGFGAGRLSAATATGSLDSPAPPDSTYSYNLEDIYNRLTSGAAGSQSAFTEPTGGPTASTGHDLEEIMDVAPTLDDAAGATAADVVQDKTFWGLTSGEWGLQAGAYPFAPVPQTGQTTSYATGDDGDLQTGVVWPNPRFTDNGDGTVTDNLTGLIWLKDANCIQSQYPGFDNDDTAGDGRITWQHALDFVTGINAGTYPDCGASFTDWRLPNIRELHSLICFGFYNPALPNTAGTGQWTEGDPFTGVQSSYYWGSTTYAYVTSFAWYVYLYYGSVGYYGKTNDYYVWPVRGGQ